MPEIPPAARPREDRPECEIEITPEMKYAGAVELAGYCTLSHNPNEYVVRIFHTMLRARLPDVAKEIRRLIHEEEKN
jgi:hypothetical protein